MNDISGSELILRLIAALENPHVQQLDIIPDFLQETDAPDIYPFAVRDGCLGIPVQIIHIVLSHAWNRICELTEKPYGTSAKLSYAAKQDICKNTLCILAINPDHHTAWNWRKRMMQCGLISLQAELQLLNLLVTYKRHCKAGLLWNHR
ncbi:Protein prenyltransferase alpha subunit repeat-containing protein 1 [Coemansia sp. RSA 1358]|nr:Protein prenyltransferase alpha subunit repeat-containing protein 1 [Coemansia sp. RSA 1358]